MHMQILCCDIRQWPNFNGLNYLCADRRARFERYKQPKDKLRCLIGGLMLYYAMGHNKEPLYNAYGKPYFENELYFNLSHSGNYVVLATSQATIGIDVEIIKKYNMDVAKKCFTPNELTWLEKNNLSHAFFKIWTAKESYMKAMGLGFNLNPASFEVLPIQNGSHIINNKEWFLYWHSLDEHELCVASAINNVHENIDKNSKIKHLSPEHLLQHISH